MILWPDEADGSQAVPDSGGSGAAPGVDGLNPAERAELERLRAEVARLHRQQAAQERRRIGWRTPVASALIILGCLLAPLSVTGVWAASQVSNTDRYLANVSPLISEPSVQHALTGRLTGEITSRLDVQGLVSQAAAALSSQGATRAGDLLDATSGSIASGVNGFIHDQIAKFVASPQAARLWAQANRNLHTQMVKVLSGQSGSAITYTHRKGLRIGAVALASVVFVFWSRPSGLVALVIALILLAVLALIELIGRPPAGRALVTAPEPEQVRAACHHPPARWPALAHAAIRLRQAPPNVAGC